MKNFKHHFHGESLMAELPVFFLNSTHQTETGTAKDERLLQQPTWSNQTI
jgi:hypothetical protein